MPTQQECLIFLEQQNIDTNIKKQIKDQINLQQDGYSVAAFYNLFNQHDMMLSEDDITSFSDFTEEDRTLLKADEHPLPINKNLQTIKGLFSIEFSDKAIQISVADSPYEKSGNVTITADDDTQIKRAFRAAESEMLNGFLAFLKESADLRAILGEGVAVNQDPMGSLKITPPPTDPKTQQQFAELYKAYRNRDNVISKMEQTAMATIRSYNESNKKKFTITLTYKKDNRDFSDLFQSISNPNPDYKSLDDKIQEQKSTPAKSELPPTAILSTPENQPVAILSGAEHPLEMAHELTDHNAQTGTHEKQEPKSIPGQQATSKKAASQEKGTTQTELLHTKQGKRRLAQPWDKPDPVDAKAWLEEAIRNLKHVAPKEAAALEDAIHYNINISQADTVDSKASDELTKAAEQVALALKALVNSTKIIPHKDKIPRQIAVLNEIAQNHPELQIEVAQVLSAAQSKKSTKEGLLAAVKKLSDALGALLLESEKSADQTAKEVLHKEIKSLDSLFDVHSTPSASKSQQDMRALDLVQGANDLISILRGESSGPLPSRKEAEDLLQKLADAKSEAVSTDTFGKILKAHGSLDDAMRRNQSKFHQKQFNFHKLQQSERAVLASLASQYPAVSKMYHQKTMPINLDELDDLIKQTKKLFNQFKSESISEADSKLLKKIAADLDSLDAPPKGNDGQESPSKRFQLSADKHTLAREIQDHDFPKLDRSFQQQ